MAGSSDCTHHAALIAETSESLPPLAPPTEQPHMFQAHPGSEGGHSPMKKRGRTFDDIREENRRQQMQQTYPKHVQWMEKQQQHTEEESERIRTGTEQRPQG